MASTVEILIKARDEFSNVLEGAQSKFQSMSKDFLAVGGVMAGMGTAIGAPLLLAAQRTAELGDELQKSSIRTGTTVEELSALKFAVEQSGGSFDTLNNGLRTMARNANEASQGTATQAEAFDALGVTVTDASGQLRPMNDLLLDAAEQFSQMTNDTEAAALAQDVFGRSGVELLPFLKSGREGIEALTTQAAELGIVFSGDLANGSAAFLDSQNALSSAFDGLKAKIGEAVLPALTSMIETVTPIVVQVGAWISENQGLVLALGGLAAFLAAGGSLLVGLGLLAAALPTIAAALGIVAAAITGPVGIAVAIAAGVAAISGFVATNNTARTALGNAWTAIKTATAGLRASIATAWEAIQDKLEGVLASIGRLFDTVIAAWMRLWDAWGDDIKLAFELVWGAIGDQLEAAFKIIGAVLGFALDFLEGSITAFTGLISGDWRMFAEGIKTIWSGLWEAIKTIVTAPIKAVTDTVGRFTGGVTGFFSDMYDKVVGNSFVPDMMDRIGDEFGRLGSEVQPAVETDLGSIGGLFEDLGKGPLATVKTALGGIFDGLSKFTLDNFPGLSAISGVFGSIQKSVTGIVDKVGGTIGSIGDAAGKIGGTFANVGGSLLSGGLGGLLAGAGGVASLIGNIGGNKFEGIVSGTITRIYDDFIAHLRWINTSTDLIPQIMEDLRAHKDWFGGYVRDVASPQKAEIEGLREDVGELTRVAMAIARLVERKELRVELDGRDLAASVNRAVRSSDVELTATGLA